MRIIKILACCASLLISEMAFSQSMWKYFSPEDFAARRKKVMEKIGDGVAVLVGAELPEAYIKFRQDNNFYYLTGVEIPDAVLILNGKNKETTLLVPDYIPNDIKTEAIIKPGDDAAAEYKFSRVISKSGLTFLLNRYAYAGKTFYLQSAP
ncbi:MAG TPA: aminopeptidase P N-terminal domain-containing protein, partial [Ferruginibacter sp.]|nr:aminopeptidase P N-terminal domain-containing protein [Ferruginibacter sp.]